MAHLEKFTRSQLPGLSTHIERKTDNHTNQDINIEFSYLNHDLLNDGLDMMKRFEKRIEEVKCLNRKDVNVACNWIITTPKTLLKSDREAIIEFYTKTLSFIQKRYNASKNVISAQIHFDESTPHCHFSFIPVIIDKKGQERVNAKQLINKKDLQTFHKNLDKYLREEIPEIYQGGILNGQTLGIETVEEIKLQNKIINNSLERVKTIEKEINKVKIQEKQIKKIEVKELMLDKNSYKIKKEDYHKLKKTSLYVIEAKRINEQNKLLKKENERLIEENIELKQHNNYLSRELSRIREIVNHVYNKNKEIILELYKNSSEKVKGTIRNISTPIKEYMIFKTSIKNILKESKEKSIEHNQSINKQRIIKRNRDLSR